MLALSSSSQSQACRDMVHSTRMVLVGDSKDPRSKSAQCRKAHPPSHISVLSPMSQALIEACSTVSAPQMERRNHQRTAPVSEGSVMFLRPEFSYSSFSNQELVRGCSWHTDPREPRSPLTQEAPEDRDLTPFKRVRQSPRYGKSTELAAPTCRRGK